MNTPFSDAVSTIRYTHRCDLTKILRVAELRDIRAVSELRVMSRRAKIFFPSSPSNSAEAPGEGSRDERKEDSKGDMESSHVEQATCVRNERCHVAQSHMLYE